MVIRLGKVLSKLPLPDKLFCTGSDCLRVSRWGMSFPNPVGLAAGFDKNAELINMLHFLGFGFAEVGTVTRNPCAGNPRPRLFRLPLDRAIINRMGLNNHGSTAIAARLMRSRGTIPIGVNVGRVGNALSDADAIGDYIFVINSTIRNCDYLTLNISCPNTSDGRSFEEPEDLRRLLTAVRGLDSIGDKPWLIKLSPDLPMDQLLRLVDVALESGARGLVLTNTTVSREGLVAPPALVQTIGRGGLSGQPLTDRSLEVVRRVFRHTAGSVPLIGVGGIMSADDAYMRIRAGASLLQVYTGLVYSGPGLVADINRKLANRIGREGLNSIDQLVGKDA